MRVFISADIEGVATTTLWSETETQTQAVAQAHAAQMTAEVKAACEGAIAAGADYILVRDAHETGTNIDIHQLPACAEVIRGWSGHPYCMVEGIDKSFDAALFIGYHSAAGREGSPLSHTNNQRLFWVKINGQKVSEFQMHSWACALEGVPTVFLSGDQMLCQDCASLHPKLKALAVKSGFGGATRSMAPALAVQKIREQAEQALRQDLSGALCTLPENFHFEICYKDHTLATKMSFFPGFRKTDDNTIAMDSANYMDLLVAARFVF